jgi:hypothetical protein
MLTRLLPLAPLLLAAAALGAAPPQAPTHDPVPQHPERGPWLFCYFNGNGDGLHLAASSDGLQFTPLNDDKVYLRPDIGNQLMRDPCLRQGPDGIYHLVWTTGWWDDGFGTASSPDLIHWSPQKFVQVNKIHPDAVNTWAPELFYDDQKNDWLIFWATTIPGQFKETEPDGTHGGDKSGPNKSVYLNHRIYYVTTKDFQSFSETKLLIDPGFNCIDATITKIPASAHGDLAGKYMMVIKDETVAPAPKKNLRVLTAASPEGPWSKASDPISKDWVEGPTIAQVGDAWYVYYDEYRNRTYGAIRTTDFKTWDVVKDNFDFPKSARHGTVFSVDPSVIARLKATPTITLPPIQRRASESAGASVRRQTTQPN